MVDFNKSGDYNLYPRGLIGIPVVYHRCEKCDFVYTNFFDNFPSEWWGIYVYNKEYYLTVDPDYELVRPKSNASEISMVLKGKPEVIGLDYGGGSGLTARLLRERGLLFDCYDPYGCQEVSPERIGRYNFCTAIEVFEHLPNPVESMRSILSMCQGGSLTILIGTALSDKKINAQNRLQWWYAAPRNGHISIFSKKSLAYLASMFGLVYQGQVGSTHVLSRLPSSDSVDYKFALLRAKLIKQLGRFF
jgi:2-polyprenyl-6-hydroxyphenyl methylase/3-demethylubiquinone-9 3-methyltransferase